MLLGIRQEDRTSATNVLAAACCTVYIRQVVFGGDAMLLEGICYSLKKKNPLVALPLLEGSLATSQWLCSIVETSKAEGGGWSRVRVAVSRGANIGGKRNRAG